MGELTTMDDDNSKSEPSDDQGHEHRVEVLDYSAHERPVRPLFESLQGYATADNQSSEHHVEIIHSSACTHQWGPLLDFQGDGPTSNYLSICRPLYYASQNGDWETARTILCRHKQAWRYAITNGRETALHIAAGANQVDFVSKLVEEMDDLTLRDGKGSTAIFPAIAKGAVEVIQILVEKERKLSIIRGAQGMTPLCLAASFGHPEIALMLYSPSRIILEKEGERIDIFFQCLRTGLYELASQMVREYSDLAFARDTTGQTALHVLARNSSTPGTKSRGMWKQVLDSFRNKIPPMPYSVENLIELSVTRILRAVSHGKRSSISKSQPKPTLGLAKQVWKKILDQKTIQEVMDLINNPYPLLFTAAEVGNYDFLVMLLSHYHDLIWLTDENNQTIFHIAVENRHANIFKLIHDIGSAKDLIVNFEDPCGNNMLHLAARLPSPSKLKDVSGAALQMQLELQWFREVEKIMHPSMRKQKNSNNKAAQEKFSETHAELFKEGKSWMQKAAMSCAIISTLFAIIVFTGAFDVLGGNNEKSWLTIHMKDSLSMPLWILNAIALSSSSTSILTFLSIVTLPFAEDDFLRSLPCRLMVGLATLFISVAATIINFCIMSFSAYQRGASWMPILVSALQILPVALFLYLQCPLLCNLLRSTFCRFLVFQPRKKVLSCKDEEI